VLLQQLRHQRLLRRSAESLENVEPEVGRRSKRRCELKEEESERHRIGKDTPARRSSAE